MPFDGANEIEQPRYRGGRQPGTPNKLSIKGVKRLAQLGFDPIEKMVELYQRIERELNYMQALKDNPVQGVKVMDAEGKTIRKPSNDKYSGMTYAQLLTIQQKLVNDLIRYGYARVPESLQVEQKEAPRLTINLTPTGGVFNADNLPEGDDD